MKQKNLQHDSGIMKEIIIICLELDRAAVDTYHQFAEATDNKDFKRFWAGMSKEESVHVQFWEDLLELADIGDVPMLLDNPEKVLNDLKQSREKVRGLSKTINDIRRVTDYFTYALRLEFYVLQPAFESLFYFMKNSLPRHKGSTSFYDNHLSKFISALRKYGEVTPELELIAEAVQKLWETNKDLALHGSLDPLSRIFNRRGFNNAVMPLAHLASRNSMTVGVLMMDIDNFKIINDTHGHSKGDEVIKAAAEVVRKSVRTSDITARYGGEEFVVYLSNISPEYIENVSEKIRKNIESYSVDGLNFTISIGAAYGELHKDIEKDMEDLLKKADEAMYKAKRLGKNRVVVAQ